MVNRTSHRGKARDQQHEEDPMPLERLRNTRKSHVVLLGVGLAVLAAGFGGYRFVTRQGSLPQGLIQANGRIEGDGITLSSKVAGRITAVDVREGQAVKAGQILVRIDDAQVRSRVDQARAAAETLESQIASARLGVALLRRETPLTVEAARAAVDRAEASVAAAQAAERMARRDAERANDLIAKGFTSSQQSERAQLAVDAAASELGAAAAAALQARKQLALADLGGERVRVKEADLLTLQAQLRQTQAMLAEAQSVLSDLTLLAPAPGVVASRMREPGEVVAAGAPLLELIDLDQLYLKVYVPEAQIGKLRLGLPAKVYSDAFPDQPYDATVRYIAARAEFTPKEVQTPDERVKLVYAVKLYLSANPDHRLSPGVPADAVIRWQEGVAWAKPRW